MDRERTHSDAGESAAAAASWRDSRAVGFLLIGLCYVAAGAVGLAAFSWVRGDLWFRILSADVAATAAVWVGSLLLDNATTYDPYWSVQPLVILNLVLFGTGVFDAGSVLLCLVVNLWGIRLTANWTLTFRGLGSQDWRYDRIRDRTGRLYPLANLLGIQLMPTLIVFGCILPAILYISRGGGFGPLTAAGLLLSLAGLLLETVADRQMHAFRRRNQGRAELMRDGLWRHARHPNYLGEILVWWGVYLVFLSAFPEGWVLGAGPLLNTLLFLFISIPMAETRLSAIKAGFDSYRRETRMLLPIPRRRGVDKFG